ncbi:MAG: type II toxin-antitoxin system prevent-host-death family antitoxin [Phycisphaeraceae bacterium]
MATISIDDIQRDLAGFLRRIQAGESLTIVQASMPVARITPMSGAAPVQREKRPFGLAKGQFIVPDDFDAPLPDEVLKSFEDA